MADKADDDVGAVINHALGSLGLKRLLRNYSLFFLTICACCMLFFKIYDLAGWDPPLITNKAYAQDKIEDRKRITVLEQNFASVKQDLAAINQTQLEASVLTLESRIQDLEREISKSPVDTPLYRLLQNQKGEANQSLGRVRNQLDAIRSVR